MQLPGTGSDSIRNLALISLRGVDFNRFWGIYIVPPPPSPLGISSGGPRGTTIFLITLIYLKFYTPHLLELLFHIDDYNRNYSIKKSWDVLLNFMYRI